MAKIDMPEQERAALLTNIREAEKLLDGIASVIPRIGGNKREIDAAANRIRKVQESMTYLTERLTEKPTKATVKDMLKGATPEQLAEVARILAKQEAAPEQSETITPEEAAPEQSETVAPEGDHE